MTGTPTDPPIAPPEASSADAQPMTRRAVEKMRALVTGNGIDPKKVELIGTEELDLTFRAEMTLTPDVMRTQKRYKGPFAGGKKNTEATQLQSPQQIEGAVAEIKKKVIEDGNWVKNAYQQLKNEAGQGWGLEDADVSLDDMAQTLFVTETCPSCGGRGKQACNVCTGTGQMPCQRCQSSGREICYQCNGTGIYDTQTNAYCPVCKGSTFAVCRQCQGLCHVSCQQCRGSGNLACTVCNGDGRATLEEKVTPIVHCVFTPRDTGDLPSGFRRAISRGGGMQSLTRGHATITMHELDESDESRVFIPYTAQLPYAEVRVRVAGKALRMTVMGHKEVILEVPPFLDARLEPEIAALMEKPGEPEALKRALKWRVMRDAFDGMQRGDDPRLLRKRYPFGISPAMLERVQQVIARVVQANTRTSRLVAGGVFLLALLALDWMVMWSGTRAALAAKTSSIAVMVFDALVCGAMAFGGQRLLQIVGLKRLSKLIGAAAVGRPAAQKMDLFDFAIMAAAIFLYLAMIALMKAPPDWFIPVGK